MDEDLAGCEHLLAQLADLPTLDGATPQQRGSERVTETRAAPGAAPAVRSEGTTAGSALPGEAGGQQATR